MSNNISGLTAAVFAGMLAVLAGCSVIGENKSRIVSISPDINTVLSAGDKLDVEVTVEYRLKQDVGSMSLVIQDAQNTPVASLVEPLKKGAGRLTLKRTITVPKTSAISVDTPLYSDGETSTYITDRKVFKVIAKK